MKKLLLITALFALFGTFPASSQEYDASASNEIFDFSPFGDEALLNLFYNALQQGRNYPTATEFEAAGFNMTDVEFVRSHVRRAALIDDTSAQLVVNNTRRVWMNIPMGSAKGIGGYPGTNPGDDTYSLWNYTHLFGSWNHGVFQAPGAWIDAAHQNGTDIMSGIKFFESWTASAQPTGWQKLITSKNTDGSFKYVKPLINCLRYFGSDGINYNWEASGYDEADAVAFHKALYKEAAAQGFDSFHIGLYTQRSGLTAAYADAMFGSSATGKTTDLMLNYNNGDFTSAYQMRSSVSAAKSAMGTADGLYAGVWIVTMNRSWTNLSGNEIGACLWGEHANSRFWSNNVGNDAQDFQANYQAMLERTFSGGNRNPARRPSMSNSGNSYSWSGTTPPLATFGGLATYFPERTPIQGTLPFHTYFNIGTGDIYNYHGKQTHGNWYNMSTQDIVPTYRWLVYNAGTTTVSTAIQPEFSIEDAWNGGSCLKLAGSATATGTDIVLYRTRLVGNSGQPYAKVAVKTGREGTNPSNLYVIVKTGGSWQEFAVGDVEGAAWQEKTVPLGTLSSSDQIDFIGLRVKGSDSHYKILVGELQINDDNTIQPASIKAGLTAEVKRETTRMFSIKLSWEVDAPLPASGLLYNDDAHIHHFEVLYKNGEQGRPSVVSHVQGWSAFVGNKVLEEDEDPWYGVRAVSTDLKTYSEPVWVHVSRSTNVPEGAAEGDLLYPGESVINNSAEGYQTAITHRYLTSVTSTGASVSNLAYAGTADDDTDNYIDAHQDAVLRVKQGDVINLDYVWQDHSDGLQWCIMKAYADWNLNGFFEGTTDELIVEQGTPNTNNSPLNTAEHSSSPLHANGYSSNPLVPFTFKVPDDAVCGKGRIRIVFTDAWAPHPGPIGLTAKGFSLDLGIEITGDNPQREVIVTRDQGVADTPEGLDAETAIRTVTQGKASAATFDGTAIHLADAEQAWVYTAAGRLVKYAAQGPTRIATTGYAPGVYIVKMQSAGVLRSQKIVVK